MLKIFLEEKMKIKKWAALALSCAVVATSGALMAACTGGNNNNEEDKGGFVQDTRTWYAVGKDTKGTLKDQGWNPDNSTYAFTKDTTVTDENVFTLTLDIYAGNVGTGLSFKFLYKTSADQEKGDWDTQVGMQHLEGKEGTDGEAELKIEGETVFTTAEDNGAYNNIALAKGQEGTYKFTLKTKSDTDKNPVISVERKARITVDYDMYVIGDINDFGVTKLAMAETVEDGKATTWSCKLNVTKADLWRNADGSLAEDADNNAAGEYAAIQLLNDRDGKTFVPEAAEGTIIKTVKSFDGTDYTCVLLKEGKYNVVFTENKTATEVGGSVAITENAFNMHLIGDFNGWKQADPDYAMTESGDFWTATLVLTDADFVDDKGNPRTVVKAKSFNSRGLTDSDKYSAGADLELTSPGTWVFKYNPEDNTVKVEKVGFHIVGRYGTMTDTTGWEAGLKEGNATALVDKGEGVYSADVALKTADGIKVVKGTVLGGVYNNSWYDLGDGQNITVTEDGTYTVTATVTGETVTITINKKAA